jgi:hypothetical protein
MGEGKGSSEFFYAHWSSKFLALPIGAGTPAKGGLVFFNKKVNKKGIWVASSILKTKKKSSPPVIRREAFKGKKKTYPF